MMAGFLPDAKKGHILLDFQGKNEVYPVQTGRLISPGTP
jgi:hypothetical protein